jgi:LPS-assembly protein
LCESGPSPWKFSAEELDLTLGGLGTVKDGYFYIMDIPVLYLPYGYFPLRTERQSGFLIPKLGYSDTEGFRFQQPFFWAPSKSTDATLTFDMETRARVGALGEFRTLFDRESNFFLNAAYYNESWRTGEQKDVVDRTIADQDIPRNRWSIIGTHRYPLPAGWLTYSDFAAFRDDLFARELVERLDLSPQKRSVIRVSRFGESRFGVHRGWGDTLFRGEWNFYQDFIQPDATTLQRTPQILFWGRRFFSGFPLEINWRGEGVNYLRREGGDGLRLDLRPEAVLPFRMASHLSGSLSVAPRETLYHLYSPVKSGQRNLSRELVEIRGNIGTSLNRIFNWGRLGLTQVKHVIEPQLSYLFVPRADQSKIPIMDEIDRIRRRNVFTLAIANRLWGKSAHRLAGLGDDKDFELLGAGVGQATELLSLRLALSYDLDKERKGGDSLTDLDVNLRFTPYPYLSLAFDGGFDPGPWHTTQARVTFSISDPRLLTRRSLDPDFNRPNHVSLSYQFLRRGVNGYLAEDANIDLDAPPNCAAHPLDPRCPGTAFNKNVVGNLNANILYRPHDQLMLSFNSTYNARDTRFVGASGAAKFLSSCECWSITFSVNHNINPAKTTFNFDFNLLGLGQQKSSLN